MKRGLTLEELAEDIGFSTAHLGAVELAKTSGSEQFVLACDRALNADGALLRLLPAAIYERASQRHRNAARRRWGRELPVPRTHAPLDVSEPTTTEQHVGLDLSPDAPLATVVGERCPGVRLSRTTPDYGVDWTLMFPGNSVTAVQVHPATTDPEGRVRVEVRDVPRLHEFLGTPHRALLLGIVHDPKLRIYALDASAVRRQLAECSYAHTVLLIPPAYELDDLTYGLLWAATNLDDCLLGDDLALVENERKLRAYQRLPSSDRDRWVAACVAATGGIGEVGTFRGNA